MNILLTKNVMLGIWLQVDLIMEAQHMAEPDKNFFGICSAIDKAVLSYVKALGLFGLSDFMKVRDEIKGFMYQYRPEKNNVFRDFYDHDDFRSSPLAITNWWWEKHSAERLRYVKAVIEAIEQDLI